MADEATKEYTVTDGNFVTGADGEAKAGGEKVKLTAAQYAELKAVKVVE